LDPWSLLARRSLGEGGGPHPLRRRYVGGDFLIQINFLKVTFTALSRVIVLAELDFIHYNNCNGGIPKENFKKRTSGDYGAAAGHACHYFFGIGGGGF